MNLFIIIFIYLISSLSISLEIVKDAHFTLSLKSQELPNKKSLHFMKIREVGQIIMVIMEHFFALDLFKA